MRRTNWVLCMGLVAMALSPGCKKGVESAAGPIKEQAEEHYTKARRLFLACDPDNYGQSIKEYQLALNLWDEYPEALAGLAEAISMWRGFMISEQEFGDAYQYAQRALRLNPELPAGYRAMADLSRHRKDYERSLRQVEMAIRIEPESAENLYVKGSALLESDPQKAYEVLFKAKKLNPELAKTYFNLASACQKLGRLQEAIGYLEKYRQMVPSDISGLCAMGMNKLGMVGLEKSEPKDRQLKDEAASSFKLAIAKGDPTAKPWQAPWLLISYKALARMDFEAKNYKDALEKLNKAMDIFADDPELQYLLAMCYKELGDRKSARARLQRALEIVPDNEDLKKELKKL